MRIVVVCTDAGVPIPGETHASSAVIELVRGLRSAGNPTFLLGVTGAVVPALEGPVMLVANPGEVDPDGREARDRQLSERALARASDVVTRFGPDVVYERLAPFADAGRRLALRTGATHVLEVDRLLTPDGAARRGLPASAVDHERELLAQADLVVVTDAMLVDEVGAIAPGTRVTIAPRGEAPATRALTILDELADARLRAS